MTFEQIGLYIKMLCLQHQHNGRIPTAELRTQCDGIANGDAVFKKFKHDEAGSYNERLQIEMEKRKQKGIKARESANKRWNKEQPKDLCESNANAMRSENINVNENITDLKIIEGGMGGDFQTEKKYFLTDDQWKYKLCSAKNISKTELEELMEIFITDIELKQDYKSNKELKSHFTNWFNLKKKEHEKRNFNQYSKHSRGAQQLLELIRQERAAGL